MSKRAPLCVQVTCARADCPAGEARRRSQPANQQKPLIIRHPTKATTTTTTTNHLSFWLSAAKITCEQKNDDKTTIGILPALLNEPDEDKPAAASANFFGTQKITNLARIYFQKSSTESVPRSLVEVANFSRSAEINEMSSDSREDDWRGN